MAIVIPIQYNNFSSEQHNHNEDGDEDNMIEQASSCSIPQSTTRDNDKPSDVAPTISSMEMNVLVGDMEPENDSREEPTTTSILQVPSDEEQTDGGHLTDALLSFNTNRDIYTIMEDEARPSTGLESIPRIEGSEEESTSVMVFPMHENSKYGGLRNLGNTCYMAAALQMLASLDGFVEDLKARVPPSLGVNDDASDEKNAYLNNSATETVVEAPKLRVALLEVLERLASGETFRPDDFKRCMDERTTLFQGYRQQDSHEFLTTLLDIIDEDYKKKPGDQSMREDTPMILTDSCCNENDDLMEQEQVDTSNADKTTELEEVKNNEKSLDSHVDAVNDHEETAIKKPRIDQTYSRYGRLEQERERSGNPSNFDTVCEDARKSSSFINLEFGDIENLLYGDLSHPKDVNDLTCGSAMEREQMPKYKLVGGRMNTSQTELTRYDRSKHLDLDALDVSSDSSNKIQEDGEALECTSIVLSPVHSNFTTEVRVFLTCESCKYRRSHTETYLHLSLQIGLDSCSNVEDCVRKFFTPEKREIKCEKCFHSTALQTMEITKLPKALLFHLKRFIVDVSPDYSSISYRKDQSPVCFEERIALENDGDGLFEEFLAPDVLLQKGSSYAIRSVVNHIGSSASCGHYTADAKRLYEGEMGNKEAFREWTRFNDGFVSKISPQEAVKQSTHTAYMVMYELEE